MQQRDEVIIASFDSAWFLLWGPASESWLECERRTRLQELQALARIEALHISRKFNLDA